MPAQTRKQQQDSRARLVEELEEVVVDDVYLRGEGFSKGKVDKLFGPPTKETPGYLDNEAARITLLKMTSDSETLSLLAHTCSLLEEAMGMFVFYGRVPSKSNVADAPSRLDFRDLPPDKRIRDDEVLAQVRAIVFNLQQSLSQGNC